MAIETFDDFNSTYSVNSGGELPPFQFREKPKDEEETLKWLTQYFEMVEKESQSRMQTYRRHLALYKGIHWRDIDSRDANRNKPNNSYRPKMVTNYIHDLTEAKVAQMARMKTSVALIPNNDQQDDVNNAKACKKLLDARAEEMGLELIRQRADRIKFLFGHVFNFVEWDKDSGPLLPAYDEVKRKGKKIEVLDEEGKPVKGKYIEEEIRIGDVKVSAIGPDRVFVENGKENWEDIDFLFKVEWVHKEKLKKDYPKKAKSIEENTHQMYDFEKMEVCRPRDMVRYICFYHKKTKYLPEGALIKFTDNVILSWEEFPYSHGKLPCIPDTDVDIYGEFWGRSFIFLIEQLQRQHNNIQSATARDISIGSAPKWMMPKGACDIHDLNNDFTIVEFTGPVAPQLVKNNPVSNDAINIQAGLEEKMNRLAGVYDISRGEVPTGVTANSALRFLDEQEGQRIFVAERKRKKNVLDVYRMMINLMGQYYKEGDGRTLRILGEDNEYLIEDFSELQFNEIYDVRLQNSPSLPDTKTGKISAIIDLNTATQTDPIFRKEEIIQLLDLGLDEAFKDQATIARTAAKSILDEMLEGEEVQDPLPSDNLLVHYDVFVRAVQEFAYKKRTPVEIRQAIAQRIMMLEALMYRRAQKNQKFAAELQMVSCFPIYFEIPTEMTAMGQMMMQQMGGAQSPVPPSPNMAGIQASQEASMMPQPEGEMSVPEEPVQ